jgi:hypothetical protein
MDRAMASRSASVMGPAVGRVVVDDDDDDDEGAAGTRTTTVPVDRAMAAVDSAPLGTDLRSPRAMENVSTWMTATRTTTRVESAARSMGASRTAEKESVRRERTWSTRERRSAASWDWTAK